MVRLFRRRRRRSGGNRNLGYYGKSSSSGRSPNQSSGNKRGKYHLKNGGKLKARVKKRVKKAVGKRKLPGLSKPNPFSGIPAMEIMTGKRNPITGKRN